MRKKFLYQNVQSHNNVQVEGLNTLFCTVALYSIVFPKPFRAMSQDVKEMLGPEQITDPQLEKNLLKKLFFFCRWSKYH